MNILHMKYAIEVARVGSISKASQNLLVAQPNLSRSIKELESDFGITIFDRTAKGMFTTSEGQEFIEYAKKIVKDIDDVEKLYKKGEGNKQKFSISVPRADYISDAFAKFSKQIETNPADIFYMETNSNRAIKNILEANYKLAIVRYSEKYDKYFNMMFDEKDLVSEEVSKFHYVLAMSKDNPLAQIEELHFEDLHPYIEIVHDEPYVPSFAFVEGKNEARPGETNRRMFVIGRASQLDILSENKETFLWTSPLSSKILDRYGLVQKKCVDNKREYRDVLIHCKDYKLNQLDTEFMAELSKSKDKYVKDMA